MCHPERSRKIHTGGVIKLKSMLDHQEIAKITTGLRLDEMGAVMDGSRTLGSGFHPLYAKDTPGGACLHIDEHDVGWVVTDWGGDRLNPRVPITGNTVTDVIHAWADMIKSMRQSGGRNELVQTMCPPTPNNESVQIRPGDYIAYLLPDIPARIQTKFITTRVTGVDPLTLANDHHKTIFASGRGEVARYNHQTDRVIFPVVRLSDVVV